MNPAHQVAPPDSTIPGQALADRTRIGLWVVVASNLLFAVTDLRLAGDALARVYLLKLLQISVVLVALRIIGRPRSRRVLVGVVLATAAGICGLVAISGALTGDPTTTLILCIAFAWGTATLLPWEVLPQAAVALIAGLAILLNLWLTYGTLAAAVGYSTVAVALALGISIVLVDQLRRTRLALERESRARARAEEDVALRRQFERALQGQERFVSTVLDTVDALIGVVDLEGRIVRLNRACKRTLGYAADEVRGRPFWELMPVADTAAAVRTYFLAAVATHTPAAVDTDWYTRAGEKRWFACSMNFLRNDAGTVEHVIGTAIDISERKRAHQALRHREQHWRALIEQSSDLIGVLDADATIRYLSPSTSRLLGSSPEAWHGHSAFELIHLDDAPAVLDALRLGIEHHDTGEPLVFRVRHADGSWRLFEGTDTNLLEDDAVRGIVVNLRDITERRAAEDALARSEAQYRLLFDGNPCPLWVFDRETLRARSVNDAAVRQYGFSRDECLSMTLRDLCAGDDALRVPDPSALDADLPAALAGVWRHRTRDGRSLEVEISAGNITFEGRGALLLLATDVTERRQVERDMRNMNVLLEQRVGERTAQLEAAVQELESFSYSVSHDLQAPIRHLQAFSRALLEDCAEQLDATARGYLERVCRSAERMQELIAALLGLSRVSRADLYALPVDLSTMAREITAELQRTHPDHRPDLAIAPGLKATGDPRLLRVALENLLGNAWKYTSKTAGARIALGAAERGGGMVYFVRDNGAGFDMRYADRLFGAFQRLHTIDEFEGTGIGLATVQRIIRRHGGRIWAEAEVGRGATFYFTLPEPALPGLAEDESEKMKAEGSRNADKANATRSGISAV